MPIVTLSPEKYLRREFIERAITRKMNPALEFLNKFNIIDLEGSSTFKYFVDEESPEDDIQKGVMSEPLPITELSNLSKIEIQPIDKRLGDTYQFGYEFEVSKKVMKENGFVDELARIYDRAAYGMARKINGDIFQNIDKFAAVSPITLNDGAWSQSSAITDDIIDMKTAFETIGWNFKLTDIMLNSTNYHEVEKYYNAVAPNTFNPNDVEDVALEKHEILIPEGTLYGLDMNTKPLTIYKNLDKDHSTIENGLINVNVVESDKYPFTTTVQLWCELGIACKYPKAMLKQTGI